METHLRRDHFFDIRRQLATLGDPLCAREHLKRIVDIQMEQVRKRMAERHIDIELTDAAKECMVNEGYDATYGARPLKRTIQRLVLDPLALQVLEGKFVDGDTIVVDLDAS